MLHEHPTETFQKNSSINDIKNVFENIIKDQIALKELFIWKNLGRMFWDWSY